MLFPKKHEFFSKISVARQKEAYYFECEWGCVVGLRLVFEGVLLSNSFSRTKHVSLGHH